MKKTLHPRNKHNNGYNFEFLQEKYPKLKEYIIKKFDKVTLDFSNPEGVRTFNSALLYAHYGIKDWNFSEDNLCPPIPGRVDYIHHLADLINDEKDVKVLDIGTGASCIYPLLGVKEYEWDFVATDIDLDSLDYAQDIIDDNELGSKITLRQQMKEVHVIIKKNLNDLK